MSVALAQKKKKRGKASLLTRRHQIGHVTDRENGLQKQDKNNTYVCVYVYIISRDRTKAHGGSHTSPAANRSINININILIVILTC